MNDQAAVAPANPETLMQAVMADEAALIGFFHRVEKGLSEEEKAVLAAIRTDASALYDKIKALGSSRPLSIAVTKLEETMHRVEEHFKG